MSWHGQLHQDPADLRICIQASHQFFHLFLCGAGRQVFTDRAHPQLLTSLALGCYIGGRVCSITHQHSRQSRLLFTRCHPLRHRSRNFSAHLLSDELSINQLSSHTLSLIISPIILSPRYSLTITVPISFHLGEGANALTRTEFPVHPSLCQPASPTSEVDSHSTDIVCPMNFCRYDFADSSRAACRM